MWNRRKTIATLVAAVIPTLLLGALCSIVVNHTEEIDQLLYGHPGAKVVVTTISQVTPPAAPTVAQSTPTPTPTLRQAQGERKQYPGLVRVDKPPEVINGMSIPAWSNLTALYAIDGDDRLSGKQQVATANSVNIRVQCPLTWYLRTHKLRDPIIDNECGLILNAELGGVDLKELARYQSGSANEVTFSLPGGKRPTNIQDLVVDIWLLPEIVYQATWTLYPDRVFPQGPHELRFTFEDMRALTRSSMSRDYVLKEKDGVGLLPIPRELFPFLSILVAEQVGREITWNDLKMRDDGWTFAIENLKPGYYMIRAFYSVPNTDKGGLTDLLVSPRTDYFLKVVPPWSHEVSP